MKRLLHTAASVAAIAILSSFPTLAGSWILPDINGWMYQKNDGNYANSGWEQIDGIYYYFNEKGYMLSGEITPDGYVVGIDGAWMTDQRPASIQDGTYYAEAYAEIYADFGIETTERRTSGDGFSITITNGQNLSSANDMHSFCLNSLDLEKGTLINNGNGIYHVIDEMPTEIDYRVKKVCATQDYIFVKCESGTGAGNGCDTTMFRRKPIE